jgi:hypothetical protein
VFVFDMQAGGKCPVRKGAVLGSLLSLFSCVHVVCGGGMRWQPELIRVC